VTARVSVTVEFGTLEGSSSPTAMSSCEDVTRWLTTDGSSEVIRGVVGDVSTKWHSGVTVTISSVTCTQLDATRGRVLTASDVFEVSFTLLIRSLYGHEAVEVSGWMMSRCCATSSFAVTNIKLK
jgi:hypothetical protein